MLCTPTITLEIPTQIADKMPRVKKMMRMVPEVLIAIETAEPIESNECPLGFP